ncbi:MAG: polyketide synthase dehydratase domain-containing protein [Deltaproteobacteria bacterium]|nr:polyketide synthase dehydratase domain-containing protein [Deltaproteobacteria bacterium]
MQSKDGNPAGPALQPMPPAHPAPVRISLQELEMQSKDGNPAGPALQPMPPAPALPPVLTGEPFEPAAAAAAVARPPSAPRARPLPRLPAAAYREWQSGLSRVHQDFVEQQSRLHEQFLAMRAGALEMLLRTGGAPADLAARAVPPLGALPAAAEPARGREQPPDRALTRKDTGAAPRILGLRLDRGKLETHASGRISEVFGPLFARQDHFPRQVRMPEPPLLLADRVIGLEAEPGSMGRGVIWTETDVSHDSWYLHEGHVPPGILIEAGQADLMLISYLGIDFHNQGERVYRLLGCELTYGELPRPGDRLQYEIRVDGHARQGDVRLFFFHSECRSQQDGALRLAVTGGQAGFFTDEELAESKGVLWEPEQEELEPEPRLDPPAVCCSRERFDAVQVRAFAEGRAADCFGPGFELCWTHSRTPRIPSGMLCLLDEVEDFQPEGGPWGRGYLRAVKQLAPDDWFFPGHFKNDPCMPGTLMFEGSLQAMAFYLAAMGTTCRRDGWRFQPVCGEPFALKSRGQATPRSRQLLYEVFVRDFVSGPVPTLHADLLCTVDGLKAFHARRVGLQLVPDWPLSSRHELVAEAEADARPAAEVDGFRYDYRSLLACAWGKPSEAFGPIAEVFDGARRVARLPSPPYHFMSRLTRIDAGLGEFRPGGRIELDYDIPPDAWYFEQNGCPRMPFAVLLEAALQPCGWLAIFVGSALQIDEELSFRNLDGTGRVLREIGPGDGTLRTRVKLKTISRTTGTIIESFDVTCELASGERVYELETVFGFFPQEALAAQVGLPTSEQQRELLEAPSDFELDLASEPARYCRGEPRLAGSMLRMLDRVTGFWPEGGKAGLGALRAEKDVRADEWFFKAHFFQDPVQPGSLGLEAMIQLLQFYMLETDMQAGVPAARFEPLALDRTMRWKYRGQVLPHNRLISTSLEIIERGRDERGPYAVAEASLWIDGRRIYEASGLGMRIVPGEEAAEAQPGADVEHPGEIVLDPERERWLLDHRPTWTRPALPLMCMLDLMARAAQGPGKLVGMRSVQARRWVIFDGARRLRVEREGDELRLVECAEQGDQEVASARIVLAGDYPEAPPAWEPVQGEPVEDLYSAGRIFHGPAFQLARSLVLGERGASWNLDFESCPVPRGALLPAVLDGATHGIPHDRLHLWSDEIGVDRIAYPAMVTELILFGPPPEKGPLRCEARFDGFFGSVDYPAFRVQIIEPGGKVWASFRQVEACFTKGPLGRAEPEARMAFLRDRAYAAGISLARTDAEGATRLTEAEVDAMDWFPGTVEAVYGTRDLRRLAIKDHLAREMEIHPGKLPEGLPLSRFHYQSDWEGEEIAVRSTGEAELDTEPIQKYWAEWFHRSRWPVEDLFQALVNRFVRRVVLDDAAAFEAVRGRSAVYLANHQVGLESLLFSILASGLTGLQALTLAKIEHKTTWLGRLIALCFAYPGVPAPRVISFFDREDRESLPRILAELANTMSAAQGKSIMVHVEGTRSLSCRRPVQRMSGLFVDLALEVGAPIVPVRFVGGLPVEPLAERIEFPIGYCKQDFWFGRPIWPDELAPLPLGKRTRKLMDAINALGPPNAREEPHAPDADFAAGVQAWIEATGARPEHAVILRALQELPDPSQETERLLSAVESGELTTGPELEDQWLAELARWLFGPRGPAVL